MTRTGNKSALDPRVNAYRADLAAARLEGKVEAPRFTEGERRQVRAPCAALRREPRPDAPLETEALMGEMLVLYDENEGWGWVQLERDAYVGYISCEALSAAVTPLTHRVTALRSFVFPGPDIKLPPLAAVSLNAGLAVEGERGAFLELASGGFVHRAHAAPWKETAEDFVAVAARFLGTPYLWGGRTSFGIDCSGLVQIALEAAGHACPRDSDQQASALGEALKGKFDTATLRRGDLVFWNDHVGIMTGESQLLHASAYHMETVIEPFDEALKRISEFGFEVTAVRRL